MTVEPCKLNLRTLPAVALAEKALLPNVAAIYFVLNVEHEVQYIGRAKSLCFRWQSHHRLADFREIPQVQVAYLVVSDVTLLPDIEQALIEYFHPPLNRWRNQYGYISTCILLPPELIEWAKDQPEGLSGFARFAMTQEQKRRKVSA